MTDAVATASRMARTEAWMARNRRRIDAAAALAQVRTTAAKTAPGRRFRNPHRLVLGVLFAAAVAAGVAVLPGEDERIAALERDGQTQRALQLLEARFARGDRSSRSLFQMQRLYDFYGDTDKSRNVLELLAAQRPRDAYIQRELAQLYKSTQDEPAYIRALQSQLGLRYSEPVCKELIGLHRRRSEYDAEHALIKTCRDRGYRRPDDLVRLAFLEASDGKMAESAQILRAVDDRRWLRTQRERQMLFAALLEMKQPDEAKRRAVRWLKGQRDEDLALDLVYKFVEIGRNNLAIEMASETGTPGDAVTLAVAEIMVDQVQYRAARAYLAGWLGQATTLDQEVTTRFIAAALDAEDPPLALQGAEKAGLAKVDPAELERLAETLIATGRGPDFDKVRLALAPEAISRNPLLLAGIALRQSRTETARGILTRVRTDDLDERRLQNFVRLADQAGRSTALSAVLREPRVQAAAAATNAPLPDAVPARPASTPGNIKQAVPAAAPAATPQSAQQAKQRILKRAAVNQKLRDRQKALKGAAAAPATPAAVGGTIPGYKPFKLPDQ